MEKILKTLALMIMPILSQAQDVTKDSIEWNVSKVIWLTPNDIKSKPATIITSVNKMKMKDADGGVLKIYALRNPFGDLRDLTKNGKIRYVVMEDKNSTGMFSIAKTDTGIRMRFTLNTDNMPPAQTEYEISGFSKK